MFPKPVRLRNYRRACGKLCLWRQCKPKMGAELRIKATSNEAGKPSREGRSLMPITASEDVKFASPGIRGKADE